MIYRFEDFSLDGGRRELRRGNEIVAIEPQVFDVLEFLIVNRERVVSSDDLLRAVWQGRNVSDGTVSTRINAVRHALCDSGAEQRLIRTLQRKGYRFAGDVRCDPESAKSDGLPAMEPPGEPLAHGTRPSIAVLPFANLSGDARQTYFADGMVDEIITALSRIKWLFVIARTSSFTYRDRPLDVRQIGRELGVRYIVEGSVRKTKNRVRITSQLIDAETGVHVSADRFEGALDDLFDLQDRLTALIVGAIAPKLHHAEVERMRRKPTGSPVAYDFFLRGTADFYRFTRETTDQALAHFQRAIQLDPDFATAHGMAALCYVRRKATGWWADEAKDTADAKCVARKAVELGNDDVIALSAGGWALAYVGLELDQGIAFIDSALELGPNLAAAWMYSGWTRIFLGEHRRAIRHFGESMRMSPRDPSIVVALTGTAFGHFLAGQYEQAAKWAEQAFRDYPNYFFANVVCACTRAVTGRVEEAYAVMGRVRDMNSTLRVSNLRNLEPLRLSKDLETWADAMRKAGLPQ